MKVTIEYDEEKKAMNALNLSDTMADIDRIRNRIRSYLKNESEPMTHMEFLEEIYQDICEIQDFDI